MFPIRPLRHGYENCERISISNVEMCQRCAVWTYTTWSSESSLHFCDMSVPPQSRHLISASQARHVLIATLLTFNNGLCCIAVILPIGGIPLPSLCDFPRRDCNDGIVGGASRITIVLKKVWKAAPDYVVYFGRRCMVQLMYDATERYHAPLSAVGWAQTADVKKKLVMSASVVILPSHWLGWCL